MSYKTAYVDPSDAVASDLNSGTTRGVALDYTAISGDWDAATGVYTHGGGVSVSNGMFASIYPNGATATGYVAEITGNDATSFTVDLATAGGTPPSTSTGTVSTRVGGSFATIGVGSIVMSQPSELNVYTNGGTPYLISASIGFPAALTFTALNRIRGFTTTPGDGGKALVRATAAITMIYPSASGARVSVEDLEIDGNNLATTGVSPADYSGVVNCKVRRCGTGILTGINAHVLGCEVTGCTTYGIYGAVMVSGCWIHDNSCVGAYLGAGSTLTRSIVTNNTGAASDGITLASGYQVAVEGNVIHGNGRHGIFLLLNYIVIQAAIIDNVITENAGYGIKWGSAPGTTECPSIRNNAFRSNSSGQISDSVTGIGTVTLTGDPYTAKASDDYSLNNTAGAGAACRAAGYPSVYPGGFTTGYPDIGVQHQDSGGGGTTTVYNQTAYFG